MFKYVGFSILHERILKRCLLLEFSEFLKNMPNFLKVNSKKNVNFEKTLKVDEVNINGQN